MTLAAPFPYFGGKRRAAPRIWDALGDPSGYVEPFAGSAAVSGDLYAESSDGIAEAVREWCQAAPRKLRIILCGYDTEHDALLAHGWSVAEGKAGGGAGYSTSPTNGRRERLWLSPACIGSQQASLLELTQ